MNKKTILIGIAILIAIAGIQVFAAQQANDYRAYVQGSFINQDRPYESSNATLTMSVAYVPVYGSETYTLTVKPLYATIDLSTPNNINTQIATAVKEQGTSLGYNVIRVFVPSYEMKIP